MTIRPLAPEDAAEPWRIRGTPEVARWWDAPPEGFQRVGVLRRYERGGGWRDGLLMELLAGEEPTTTKGS
jgi:hypothetical protein